MVEAGKYQEALEHAEKHAGSVVDQCALQETRADLLMRLERFSEAETIYRGLIDRNPENRAYYKGLELALSRSQTDCSMPEADRVAIYTGVSARHAWASLPRKLPLEFLDRSSYERHADAFLRRYLHKGVPPLFTQVAALYSNAEKAAILGRLVSGYCVSLERCGLFNESDPEGTPLEPPTTLIWANFFLAQHLSKMNRHAEALAVIDKQIEHTPTLIEFYALKGQVYRAAGDFLSASRWLDEAQSLDTADRYINTQCAQYMVEANRIADAETMAAKFTRVSFNVLKGFVVYSFDPSLLLVISDTNGVVHIFP